MRSEEGRGEGEESRVRELGDRCLGEGERRGQCAAEGEVRCVWSRKQTHYIKHVPLAQSPPLHYAVTCVCTPFAVPVLMLVPPAQPMAPQQSWWGLLWAGICPVHWVTV